MERVQALSERIAQIAAYLGGALLFFAAGLIVFEVIARKYFHFSITGADELAGYAYALSMTWGFAYAFHKHAHIRVDVIYLRLPFKLRCFLDLVTLVAFTGLVALLAYHAFISLEYTIAIGARSDTPLATPLSVPQSLWFAGLLFFGLCLLIALVRALQALVRGDYRTIESITQTTHEGSSQAE